LKNLEHKVANIESKLVNKESPIAINVEDQTTDLAAISP